VLSESDLDYVAAARLRNESIAWILFSEILPNVAPPILVEATVRLGYAVFTVATLSFIGFGIQPPSPDWGLAVSESYGLINGGIWWPALFNTLAISSLVIAVNLAADGIQRALKA
jgi:peptide/nickel transport system permease protein